MNADKLTFNKRLTRVFTQRITSLVENLEFSALN
jgi:hypothetical protein